MASIKGLWPNYGKRGMYMGMVEEKGVHAKMKVFGSTSSGKIR